MSDIKCDICGKTFLGHDDNEEVRACEECRETALDELSDGKGEDDE